MTKADLPEVQEAYKKAKRQFARRKVSLRLVSAATGEGVRELLFALVELATEDSRTACRCQGEPDAR